MKFTTAPFSPTSISCIDAILRRLICGDFEDISPTHLAGDDHHPTEPPSNSMPTNSTSTPGGVVARLMGLDDMPSPLPSSSTSLRRFLQTPTFLTEENDEFLLLSFSPHHSTNKTNNKKKKRKKKRRVESGEDPPNSQNSSPMSVLDCPPVEFADVESLETSSSSSSSQEAEEMATCMGDSTRRRRKLCKKLDALEVVTCQAFTTSTSTIKFSDVKGEACKFADSDVMEGENWNIHEWGKFLHSEEIGLIIGYQIMDSLLREVAIDLSQICK